VQNNQQSQKNTIINNQINH